MIVFFSILLSFNYGKIDRLNKSLSSDSLVLELFYVCKYFVYRVDSCKYFSSNKIVSMIAMVVRHRSPAMPPSCFRGACYLEKLDVLRENGHHTVGLRLHIFYEGS